MSTETPMAQTETEWPFVIAKFLATPVVILQPPGEDG
jgi:hypothetical protein